MTRIKFLRLKNNIPSNKMAEIIGISENWYSVIELGKAKCSFKVVICISKILEVPIELIFGENGYAIKGRLLTSNSELNKIMLYVSSVTEIEPEAMAGKSRKREIVQARQLFYYFGKDKVSLSTLGSIFEQDHATALHGYKTISNLNENNKLIKDYVSRIRKKISS